MGAVDAFNRWANGHMTIYRGQSALTESRRRDETDLNISGTATEVENSGFVGTPRSLGLDDAGRLWVSTSDAVFYLERGRFIRVPGVPGGNIFSIVGDGHGNVWILDGTAGIFHWCPDATVQQSPWPQFERKTSRAMLPDRERGALWLGFLEGGLVYLRDGKAIRFYGAADGLGDGRVTHLRFGPNGGLWVSTEGGLSRIKDGHIATLAQKNGLPCDEVHWSMEDEDHAVWLYMPCGLVRIARPELDAWINDPKHVLKTTVFDNSDGVRSVGVYGSAGPHVTRSPDGRIWFESGDGVSVIDPHHLAFNRLPPPVHVEQVTADRKTYWQNWSGDASSSHPKLPPLVRDLAIDYTALSLVAPEKVLFRYKLEGWDQDWQDAGNERKAFYSNLPPRNYRFRVIASNNSGVWNDTGASLDFAIAPAYYQTKWFRALCVAAFVALLWAAYRVRVRQLRRQEKKLRDVVETIPAIAWTALPDGWVDFSNHHWEEYTGLSLEKGAGSGWEAAVHPEDVKRHAEKWRASVASGKPFENEARYRRADGEYRWFLVRAVPLRDGGGKIRKWYGTKTDIEDRKRAEQLQADLTHASRISTMGELVASISHELAQPLQVTTANAKASLRWLQRDPPEVTEARKGTEKIIESGALASEIINRLRSLYKKSPPKRELIAINEVIGEMVPLLRSEANEHAVSIRTDLAADLPKITADRVQLQQVLNGIEAMKDTGGVLTVKSQLDGDDQLLISISDTGVGLPAEKADQIFDAFFTTKTQGSGMGLAISRSIVDSHGGRLWATANDGRGATFYFTLRTAAQEVKAPLAVT
jgi:PAS domain S-box-containing protein